MKQEQDRMKDKTGVLTQQVAAVYFTQ